MAYAVLKLAGEPILVVKIVLPLEQTLCAARHLWYEINQQADQSSEPFYAIFDLSTEQPDFSDILLWIDERRTSPEGRYRSPQLRTVLVGSHMMVALAARKIQRQLGVEISHYDLLDEALVQVHSDIATYRASSIA